MNRLSPIVLIYGFLLFHGANRGRAAAEVALPEATLEKAGMFALGGIGAAGTMSPGERALRELFAKPDAATRMDRLLTNATPAGQLYALLGLRLKDHAAYERALEKCRKIDAKVETARGCILQHESFRDLVKEIERGQYDTFLDRKWPEGAR
jgi:hypothetical protein